MKTTVIFLISILLFNATAGFAQTNRGAGNVKVKKEDGKIEEIKLYEGSYALVVGVSDYTNGWKDLSGVKTDVAAVKEVLEAQGFTVRTVLDPTGEQLQAALN
ncbi:MAG: caspase family protein, partial [Pyrinomonadaceae bacterium]|nr:caspase family protein [Pyrinomonadaceae bacterium]